MTSRVLPAVPWLIAAAALLLADATVRLARRYTLRRGVLDVPNARSSHSVPTPRGGGLGVVASVLGVGGPALWMTGVSWAVIVGAGAAVAAVAAVGWVDDHRPLPVRVRFAIHLLAGCAVAVLADRWLPWPGAARLLMAAWWLFWTVSAVNVVNFMDGIDGLVGSQLALYALYVVLLAPPASATALLGVAVAAASLGFLRWNWAPAAIFLGDVGSGAYGLLAVLLGLGLVVPGDVGSIVRAYLPLFPLFLDASTTLVRRMRAGERVTTPHRSHLYQRLANGPWGHARTSLAYAMAAALGCLTGMAGAAVSDAAAVLVTAAYGAGVVAVGWRLDRLQPWRPARAEVTRITVLHAGRDEAQEPAGRA